MVFKPLIALAATAVLLAVAAALSPDRERGELWAGARRRAVVGRPGGALAVSLSAFGIAAGIPLALGLVPGSAVLLIGALVAPMVARVLLSDDPPEAFLASGAWFVVLAWCVVAGALRFKSLDLSDALGAQAVLGPAGIGGPTGSLGATALALVAGLLAAAMWASSLPRISGSSEADSLDRVLRWGETTLAATAVAAPLWGPSLGALALTPLGPGLSGRVAISFLTTVAAVAAASVIRRGAEEVPPALALSVAAPTALAVLFTMGLR
ncbi:MAG: hypothetical protein ACRDJ4_04335 [Actinomycetota bacterium]